MLEVIGQKTVKIRKDHMCFGCGRNFPKGTLMERSCVIDNGLWTCYLCPTCKKIPLRWNMVMNMDSVIYGKYAKAVMLSIRSKWCEKIVNGKKTIEVRKTRPKLQTPFKCYIYCTKDKHLAFMQNASGTNLIACMNAETAIPVGGFLGNGKVIGEFTCDQIIDAWWDYVPDAITREVAGGNLEALDGTGMTDEELFSYVRDSMRGHCYGWHISNLRIYDQPRELTEFRRHCPNDLYCEACAMYSNNNDICNNVALPLRRPPQSWCYVEEWEQKELEEM